MGTTLSLLVETPPRRRPTRQRPLKQSFCRSLVRDPHWKCLLLTMLIVGCLAAIVWCRLTVVKRVVISFYDMPLTRTRQASPCDDGYVYIPVAFVVMLYLVYLVECWHSHTRLELQHKVDTSTVYARIDALREALPVVWWRAVCYHYVRRTRQVTRYRNGDAFTTTQVYYERVNSHSASSAFNFSTCGLKDISRNLVDLDAYPATKIRFTRGFSFATVDAENEFEEQRGQFFQEHERRDDYMETREGLDLLNITFKEHMIAFADPEHLPWYVSHITFWISSMLLLSWPLRVLIDYKTAYVHYHVHKLFGVNYLDPYYCPGQMTRVSTMESSELEMNIRNNYAIVPSYSEALLMDVCTSATHQTSELAMHYAPGAEGNRSSGTVIANRAVVQGSGRPGSNYGTLGSSSTGPREAIYENGQVLVISNPAVTGAAARSGRRLSEGDATERQRRRRRKRKRPRSGEQIYMNMDILTAEIPASPSDSDGPSSSPTAACPAAHPLPTCRCHGQPLAQNSPDSPDTQLDTTEMTDPSNSPPTEAFELTDTSQFEFDLQDTDAPSINSSPRHGVSHAQGPPPGYEEALHMRIASTSASSSPTRRVRSYQLKCIETSL